MQREAGGREIQTHRELRLVNHGIQIKCYIVVGWTDKSSRLFCSVYERSRAQLIETKMECRTEETNISLLLLIQNLFSFSDLLLLQALLGHGQIKGLVGICNCPTNHLCTCLHLKCLHRYIFDTFMILLMFAAVQHSSV